MAAVHTAYAADFLDCFFERGLMEVETLETQRSSFFGMIFVQKKATDQGGNCTILQGNAFQSTQNIARTWY